MISTLCRGIKNGSRLLRPLPKQKNYLLAAKNMSTHTEDKVESVWDYPRPPALEKVSKRYIRNCLRFPSN